jgi:cyanophycin synthetase
MLSSQQLRLIESARQAGISIEDLSIAWSQDAVRYSLAGREEVVFEGALLGSSHVLGTTLCNDLPITRHYLKTHGIPTPNSKVFKLEEEQTSKEQLRALLGDFWVDGKTYTCMPAFGGDGHGHGYAGNITDMGSLEMHLDTFADDYATWILDEQVEGEDLQVLVVGGSLTSAVILSALRLTGDGQHTLEELIEQHNVSASEDAHVAIDAETRQLLRDQNIFLSEVVPAGKAVQVKNPGAGAGGAQDVTGSLHGLYGEWAGKIAAATGLRLFSMRVRCGSPQESPQGGAWVMGLSAKPNWLAFEQAEGNGKDVAKLILGVMFGG